ncbi:MAG: substrate-binding domain-containing protein [Ruminococcus sp.]|uniref:substrate-binding domain-containing protein n=1 Tax=Ruminococcus sp. TaxID=41978 RepID=UPI0025E53B72|nr:substrate-binding domain-containing protein [Ruminococcus sp.]MBR5683753.1 substrate-binding domain-containing protein [Ruminococcus sp.]
MRKRLALITANTDTLYQTSMIKVMSEQSAILGYDLIVLTHFVNYDDGGDYMKGDENIYSLIFQLEFDGAIVDLGSFYSRSLAKKLDEMLKEKNIPVVSLDYQSEHFEDCLQNDRECFRKLTEHFIKEHGFTDIYCLSGPEGEIHSEERINGFKDALSENGLEIRQDHIFYGDFWIGKAVEFAEKIVSGELPRPQAIVCGSDYMALQLCLTLINNGIRIPEEISVGGYDGNPDVNYYQPSLTSFSGAYLENAVNAVCRLHELISGEKEYEIVQTLPYLRIGASCGCRESIAKNADISQRMLDRAMRANIFMHSNYSSIMSNVKDIREFAEGMLRNMYLLDLSGDFFICLCDDMFGDSNSAVPQRKSGYTMKMKCIVTHINYKGDAAAKEFRLESIIPEEDMISEPRTFFCTPLHYLDNSFGYCVRRYSSKEIVFEQFYGEFCQIAADSIERIRMLEHEKYLNEKIQRLSERDILTGLFSRKGIINHMEKLKGDKEYFGVLYNIEDIEQTRRSLGEEHLKRVYVSFAQAVNLSCVRGELAARISRDEFLITGECDGSEFPGQLFINTLKANIKMIEKHQDIQLLPMISHFSAVTDNISAPELLISRLEQKLEESRDPQRFAGNVYMSIIRQLHDNIYEEPQLSWNAAAEAAKLRLSQSYFQHIYKKYVDVSFNSDVISARIALAERLLVSTNLNVCEVAEKCGYTEQSYFMKLFKNKTGMTALEYKRKKLKGYK